MKFTREFTSALMVRSIGDGTIRVGEETYTRSIALTPENLHDDWPETAIAELRVTHFDSVFESDVELVILGTGESIEFAPKELVFGFARLGIGLEVMDSKAAARTYNVLAGEGRRVAAVLYI